MPQDTLRTSTGKFVPQGTPGTWFMLDRARFHLLSPDPTPSDIFDAADVRAAYEILSRAASNVLYEYLTSKGHGQSAGQRQCLTTQN